MIKWTEKLIRLALFRYCYEERNSRLLAHQVCNNDFVAVIKDRVYEFEIKISLADLKKEIISESKKWKHEKYSKAEVYAGKRNLPYFIPNAFYFVVPIEIVEKTIDFCNAHFPRYGVISVGQWPNSKNGVRDGNTLILVKKVEKRAKPLRPKGDIKNEIDHIMRRINVLVIDYYREQMKGEGVKFAFYNE